MPELFCWEKFLSGLDFKGGVNFFKGFLLALNAEAQNDKRDNDEKNSDTMPELFYWGKFLKR